MRFSEILHLVRLNLTQNKFKVLLTSIGIIVGAATIVIVIAIGRGGKADIAEQFRNLNAGAIDISYEQAQSSSGFSFGSGEGGSFPGGGRPDFGGSGFTPPEGGGAPDFSGGRPNRGSGESSRGGGFFDGFKEQFASFFGGDADTKNTEKITLSTEDMDDLYSFVPGLSEATISYTTKQNIYGGNIEETESYTVAGTLSDYADLSNLSLLFGDYLTDTDNDNKSKVCVLGYNAAKQIFGSPEDAYDSLVYIDDRPYNVTGVLFVSVKERTKEIGILKAIGGSRRDILLEFMLEACCISLIGGILGVLVSFAVCPVLSGFSIRMEMSVTGAVLALGFSLVTGTVFGFYPAWKASKLVPVEALQSE